MGRRQEGLGTPVPRTPTGSDAPLPGAPNVGFGVPQTLERFELWGAHTELWGAHTELSLPGLPAQRSHGLARRAQRTRDAGVYTGSGHLGV